MSVMAKYFYHFTKGGVLVELQWHMNQNKIVVGFLLITLKSLGKVTSLLITSKSLKSSLLDIVRTRLELKAWSPHNL